MVWGPLSRYRPILRGPHPKDPCEPSNTTPPHYLTHPKVLRNGGKIGVLTWKHSECAILVDYSRRNEVAGPEAPMRQWYENELAKKTKGLKKVPKKVGIVVEQAQNPTEAEVRGWGVYCCDFLLLPGAPSVSCLCLDAQHTRSSKLPPSPSVSHCLPMSTTRLSYTPFTPQPPSRDTHELTLEVCGAAYSEARERPSVSGFGEGGAPGVGVGGVPRGRGVADELLVRQGGMSEFEPHACVRATCTSSSLNYW